MDVIKLFYKETIYPEGARLTFLIAPYAGLFSAALVATIIGSSIITPEKTFVGDLIVVLYLLLIPAISLIIGASSSANPLASIGASREMKLVLGYELPFILAVVTAIIKSGAAIKIGSIITCQVDNGSTASSYSGMLAFIAALLCMQAKLGLVPFDLAESEQELMAGALIEYSGPPLAVFKLTRAILFYAMPLFLIVLFWAENLSGVALVGKYAALLLVMILIKNTNPRLRVDQALRFFWGPVTALAVAALILALFGL
jgi:NADH-quinone oxidoreductase subunit H